MCIVEQFVDNLFSYLISNTDNKHYSGIIKRHNDKFEQFGEFSFPWRVTAWRKFITWPPEWDNSTDLSIFDVTFRANTVSLEDACNKIKEKSKELPLLIKECKIVKDRVHIFLDRTFLIKQCFINGAVNLEPHNVNREKKLYFTIDKGIEDDISHYRLELVSKAAKNMAINDGYCVTEKFIEGETIKIHFTCKSSNKSNNAFNVVCAPVLNSKSGSKEKQISSAEYLE